MATFVSYIAEKIVKPKSADIKIAVLNLRYDGASLADLRVAVTLDNVATFSGGLAGVTVTLDRKLSPQDPLYLGGKGLRAWISVDPALFFSSGGEKYTLQFWTYDASTPAVKLVDSDAELVQITLNDEVEVISVQNTVGDILRPVSGKYVAYYYPDSDTRVSIDDTTTNVKVASIVAVGGRTVFEPNYTVYLYEPDGGDGDLAEGSAYTLTASTETGSTTIDIFYDVGADGRSTRDKSLQKDISIVITDMYRSARVTLTIIPVSNPVLRLRRVEPLTYDEIDGRSVYITPADYSDETYHLADIVLDNGSFPGETYTYTVTDIGSFVQSGSSLAFPMTVLNTTTAFPTNISTVENGRVFSVPVPDPVPHFSLHKTMTIKEVRIQTASIVPDDGSISRVDVLVQDGYGNYSVGITPYNTGAPSSANQYESITSGLDFEFASDNVVADGTVITKTFSFTPSGPNYPLPNPSTGYPTTAAFIGFKVKLVSDVIGGVTLVDNVVVEDLILTVFKSLKAPNEAWHIIKPSIRQEATVLYIDRATFPSTRLFGLSDIIVGGYPNWQLYNVAGDLQLAFRVTNVQLLDGYYWIDYDPQVEVGDVLYSIDTLGVWRKATVLDISASRLKLDAAVSGTAVVKDRLLDPTRDRLSYVTDSLTYSSDRDTIVIRENVIRCNSQGLYLEVSSEHQSISPSVSYDIVWYDTLDKASSAATRYVLFDPSRAGTNSLGFVYNSAVAPHIPPPTETSTYVFNGANSVRVADPRRAVVKLERKLKDGGVAWEVLGDTWVDPNATLTLTDDSNPFDTPSVYATLQLTGDAVFDKANYLYRIVYTVSSYQFPAPSQLVSVDGHLESTDSQPTTSRDIVVDLVINSLFQPVITPQIAWDDTKYPLNFNPYGDSSPYIDYAPWNAGSGLPLDPAHPDTTFKLPAYNVLLNGRGVLNFVTDSYADVHRYMLTIVDTVPADADDVYGVNATVPTVTYDSPNASSDVNSPHFFLGSPMNPFVTKVLYFDQNKRLIAHGPERTPIETDWTIEDIIGVATPSRPTATGSFAIVFVHALTDASAADTYLTVDSIAYKIGIVNSGYLTDATLAHLTALGSHQFPDAMKLYITGVKLDGVSKRLDELLGMLVVYVIRVRANASSPWYVLESDFTTGVTLDDLITKLSALGSSSVGLPERAFTAQYTVADPEFVYDNVDSCIEYQVLVQNKVVYNTVGEVNLSASNTYSAASHRSALTKFQTIDVGRENGVYRIGTYDDGSMMSAFVKAAYITPAKYQLDSDSGDFLRDTPEGTPAYFLYYHNF